MVNEACVILTTTNIQEIADKITHELLIKNYAACVQIDEIKSPFKWENNIEYESEFRLMIKAKSSNYLEIEKIILENHNYRLPQIIKLDIAGGLQKSLNWISSI